MATSHVQRRLAAILAADVVGYSRLTEADEDGTRARLWALHLEVIEPRIASSGGRIVKTMGDGLLAEFASVVDAVHGALSIQGAMGRRNADIPEHLRIALRIGLNAGDVIVEGDDIHGDGVNVAARLKGLCEPGAVYASGTVHDQAAGKVAAVFEDLGAPALKNISRPVRVYRVGEDVAVDAQHAPRKIAASPAAGERPSIAVLPFDNLSNNPEQEYFSDGMAEDLITDISKISGVSVAARNSSFAFKGRAADVKDIAKQLGVKHIVEGSVRKMGSRLRINAQLIDGASGRHIWAERYDGDMAEIFEFQDAIRDQIVAALQISLTPTDAARTVRKPTDSVAAHDLFLRGRANYYRFTPEHLLAAIQCFEDAIDIDPQFADAYSYLSYCQFQGFNQLLPGFDDALQRANNLAEKGVALGGTPSIALTRLGWIQTWLHRFDDAVANLEKARAAAPDDTDVLATFDNILNFCGEPQRGLQMMEQAISKETFAPLSWEFQIGRSHLLLEHYEQAIVRFERMAESAPKFIPAYTHLVFAYMATGRSREAGDAVKTLRQINPRFTVKEVAKRLPYRNEAVRTRFLDSLRKAGLPEG